MKKNDIKTKHCKIAGLPTTYALYYPKERTLCINDSFIGKAEIIQLAPIRFQTADYRQR